MVEYPSYDSVPWKLRSSRDQIVDLMNEDLENRDLTQIEYDEFIDDLEIVLDGGKKRTTQELMSFPTDLRPMEQKEYEQQQVVLILDMSDSLLKRQLQTVLVSGF
jgi:hypothetical protein